MARSGIFQKGHVLRLREIGQIDQDADFAAKGGLENGVQQPGEIELRELAAGGRGLDGGHGGCDHRAQSGVWYFPSCAAAASLNSPPPHVHVTLGLIQGGTHASLPKAWPGMRR
jgi:hypothetical protein